jgi:predicted metal-dependent phosphoesterase TrpH
VIAVTDHDTTAAIGEVRGHAHAYGIEVIGGIEITAIDEARDVHVLGYFIDPREGRLQQFLDGQRLARVARAEAIAGRLAELGLPVDTGVLTAGAEAGGARSIGRPQIARAMIAAGHVADVREAFDRWLGQGRPAFVPRPGATPEAVIGIIHDAGGVASLAHPGKLDLDHRIPALAAAGLDAVEAFHPDHNEETTGRYIALAHRLGLLLTGGSDFHGDPARGLEPGSVTLPDAEFERLLGARANARR